MLLVRDDDKSKLEESKIQYAEYATVEEVYLNVLLEVALARAMSYNDTSATNGEDANKYITYLQETGVIDKCFNRVRKLEHDVENLIVNATEDKHEEIMNFVKDEDK